MKKVTVVTATRAEYGLLKPVFQKLCDSGEVQAELAVTGAHLSPAFGDTWKEIEKDGLNIAAKIPILDASDSPAGISRTMGNAMSGFGEYFEQAKPDMLVVLGDRYETLAVCCAAVNARIPIAHLHGGETTEGAVDEAFRHAITKMSYLHFTSTQEYRRRVIQLGEDPERVFAVGAVGVENAMNGSHMDKEELASCLGISSERPFAAVTFHPVTLEEDTAESQMEELLSALDAFPEMQFIFTKSNADTKGRALNRRIDEYAAVRPHVQAYDSLGQVRYLSLLKYAEMVIGNSSSGLLEAPAFHIPTVNIGDRQRGRIQADSVISCGPRKDEIVKAIRLAQTTKWRERAKKMVNPYGGGNASGQIAKRILQALKNPICLKKSFYDVDFVIQGISDTF